MSQRRACQALEVPRSTQRYRSQKQKGQEEQRLVAEMDELVRLRSQEGYMAACEDPGDGTLLFVENHCPICAAATSCQGFCRAELSVFRAVLGPGVEVERAEHILAGARRCAYVVKMADQAA